jgi:diguanylate cyclase (GGDEF)-like protein
MNEDVLGNARTSGNKIVSEQVFLVFDQMPTMQMTSFLVALVLAFSVRNTASRANILAWLLMVLAIVISRIVLYYRFKKIRELPFDGAYWKNAFLFLALVSGTVWGLSAFLMFPADDNGLIALFVLVIASLSAATTISHSSLKWGAAAWAVPAMMLYAVRCFMEGGELDYTIGLLIGLYLFTIINHSFKHHRAITASVSLKFENLKLVEELRQANEVLRQSSARDGLTGLANRTRFEEFMEREWRRALRARTPISLIMLDIDHFKPYNDNYGHQEGDECLKKVAAVIAETVKRSADLVARYGGEEFMAVLPDTDLHGALEIAEKLRISVELLRVPHAHSSAANIVTVSIGVASLVPVQGMDRSSLVKLVDTALYAAKRDGRNRVRTA